MKERERKIRIVFGNILVGVSILLMIASNGYAAPRMFSMLNTIETVNFDQAVWLMVIMTFGFCSSLAMSMLGRNILFGDSAAKKLSRKAIKERLEYLQNYSN